MRLAVKLRSKWREYGRNHKGYYFFFVNLKRREKLISIKDSISHMRFYLGFSLVFFFSYFAVLQSNQVKSDFGNILY
jgi:hypothetical protein